MYVVHVSTCSSICTGRITVFPIHKCSDCYSDCVGTALF